MSFADRIRQSRNEMGLSQEQLAELVGVSRQCITKWESQLGYPEMQKVLLISALLNVSVDWLFESEIRECGRNFSPIKKENNTLIGGKNSMSLHTMGDESMSRNIDDFTNPVRVGIVPTGMESIDSRIGGMYRGCTYFVLGAPEIGKLPFVLSIADNIINNNGKVAMFLKKHTARRVLKNLISISSDVSNWVKDEEYTEDELNRIQDSQELYRSAKLFIDDSYGDSVEQIYEKSLNMNENMDLIIVDSARLLYSNIQVSSKSKKLRIHCVLADMARECRCPVIVIDRLDSNVEKMVKEQEDIENIIKSIESNPDNFYMDNIWVFKRDDYYTVNHNVEKSYFSIIIKDLHRNIEKQQVLQADMIIRKKSGRVYDIAV